MRKPFIAGNWKMHKTAAEAVERITQLEQRNRFKRRLMLIARLSSSAINLDREIPRD